MSAADASPHSTPRTRKRGRRPKTYEAVLTATTGLLEHTSLSELSVAQILAAADVGRTSFYEHFSSKEDVLVKLLRAIAAEVSEGLEPIRSRGERPVEEAFREGLGNWMRIGARYRPLLVATIEEWPAVPALRRVWFAVIDAMTAELASLITADRAAGLAPPGAPAEALAASLACAPRGPGGVALASSRRISVRGLRGFSGIAARAPIGRAWWFPRDRRFPKRRRRSRCCSS
jgi:AcrR family transcriptional regulator